jgi:hypothetical protein
MAFTCNIDRKGRRLRAINGFVLILAAITLTVFFWTRQPGMAIWIIVAFCYLAGAFCIFEGLIGWCALRAMGFKTPH